LHISALETAGISQLEVGQAVSYELAEQRGKQSATEITVI
jgi:cold shock CspA family protein